MSAAILIVLGAALVYAVVRMKAGAEWAPKAAVGLAIVVIVFAVGRWGFRGGGDTEDALAEAASFEQVRARVAADALAKQVPQGRTVVVFALTSDADAHDAMVEGLKAGFGPHGVTVAALVPPIAPGDGGRAGQRRACKRVLASHGEAGGVLVFGDAAADMEDLRLAETGKHALGIVARRLTPREAVERVKEGSATVVIVPRPGVDWAQAERIESMLARFEQTHLVVTPETVDEIEKALR